MRIVVAPQAFKGTLSATQAALAMSEGVLAVYPSADVARCPVADAARPNPTARAANASPVPNPPQCESAP